MSKSHTPIVLGTAGHIDHGKTSLVRALTGIDTDRLREEKERGITTELGFAHLDLGGRRFGVVDVPGHERFIKSMVAGATGLDLVCMVVAADEGPMPQTREHLDICHLLGVRRGVIALTKSDLVEDEWVAMITEEVAAAVAGSFLADARVIPVSTKTGEGIDELRREILSLTSSLAARPADGILRLPLDRIFSIKGFGTVVTGTVSSGRVKLGDSVEVLPRRVPAKVRGIQVHGSKVEVARAGSRCALNLAGPGVADLARGDTVVRVGAIAPAHLIDVRFRYLKTSRGPLDKEARVLIHHGTAQVLANLVLIDPPQLSPGEEALAQLRIDSATPLTALPGDRFIARGFALQDHYGTTIGGGDILRVHAPKARRRQEDVSMLAKLARVGRGERLALEVDAFGLAGTTARSLQAHLGWGQKEIDGLLAELAADSVVVAVDRVGAPPTYAHSRRLAAAEKVAVDRVRSSDGQMSLAELRTKLPAVMPGGLFDELVAILVKRGAIERVGDTVTMGSTSASSEVSPLAASLARHFETWAVTPPRPNQVAAEVEEPEAPVARALAELISRGMLIKVKPDLYVHPGVIESLRLRLSQHLDAHREITPLEWKAITGASRKYSIPLAEYFDQERLTLRVGDVRRRRG